MSYIEELRERFLAAEQRFGQIGETSRVYRERLMGLMSRIEEEIRCRRDVEQQQAKEIERLSGENEQLRTMMMSLLTAVEVGDTDGLGSTLNEMDTKVSALIGEGQGAPGSATPAAADPGVDAGDAVEEVAFAPPAFSASAMMSGPADSAPFSGDDGDLDHGDDAGFEAVAAEEAFIAEPAEQDDLAAVEDDALTLADTDAEPDALAPVDGEIGLTAEDSGAGEPAPADADRNVASEMADFFGADEQIADETVPDYSHAVAGWEDFLEDDQSAPAADAPGETTMDGAVDEASEAASDNESLFDDVAETPGESDPGSIHELMDRVKTEIEGDDQDLKADDSDKSAAK